MAYNKFADTARARKVAALLGVLPRGRTQAENDLLAQMLETLSVHQRGVFEVLAALKNPASPETWRLTIAAVRARHIPGDGGSLDRRELWRPDFAQMAREKFHAGHEYAMEGGDCPMCDTAEAALESAYEDGVTATLRAVGL